MSTKTLVIGWDGGCFKVLDTMIAKGLMPNLQLLIAKGVRAPFISTLPPLTSPAWTSFRTGKSPANHGLFGFFKSPEHSLEIRAIERHSAESIKETTFWNILNKYGKKVCVIDMPLTDPVEKIDGVMVSGMITRGKLGVLTYPEGVRAELTQAFPDYFGRALVDGIDTSARFLDRLITSLEWKRQEDLFLMTNHDWDCFTTVFSAVDTLQHYFWKYIDPASNAYRKHKKITKRIETFFGKLDDVLACYLEKVGPDASVFIVSDHGFGPANNVVYVNNFLEELGQLKTATRCKYFGQFFINKTNIKKLLKRVDFLHLRSLIKTKTRKKINSVLDGIRLPVAWEQTRAYFRANSEEGIYINSKDKFKNGCVSSDEYAECVESLIEALAELKNPQDGQSVFEFVRKRSDVHRGVYQKNAPDIILRPSKGYVLRTFRNGGRSVEKYDDPFLSGTHSRRGIFIAAGPGFVQGGQLSAINIEDFTPTLLYTMEVPLPNDLDGQIRLELFNERARTSRSVASLYSSKLPAKEFQKSGPILEEDEMKKRLSLLGYID
ncbi:MAG: alkaline phosphatase family protein [Desulfobacteraceae bacterium]|nr:alkaline phosphatase family protein [Desulfobacteraceae bacterium]